MFQVCRRVSPSLVPQAPQNWAIPFPECLFTCILYCKADLHLRSVLVHLPFCSKLIRQAKIRKKLWETLRINAHNHCCHNALFNWLMKLHVCRPSSPHIHISYLMYVLYDVLTAYDNTEINQSRAIQTAESFTFTFKYIKPKSLYQRLSYHLSFRGIVLYVQCWIPILYILNDTVC